MNGPEKIHSLREILGTLKIRRRDARLRGMDYRKDLLGRGASPAELRRNKTYRLMKKEQKKLSLRMKHLVKEINRRCSKLNEEK